MIRLNLPQKEWSMIPFEKAGNMQKTKKTKFSQSVATVAGSAVSLKGYVSVIDLMLGLNWLTPDKVNDWKKGKIPYLERVITANLAKISRTMKEFKAWALYSKLKPSQTMYKHKSYRLRFSKSGHPSIELAYSTHYVLQMSSPKKRLVSEEPGNIEACIEQ